MRKWLWAVEGVLWSILMRSFKVLDISITKVCVYLYVYKLTLACFELSFHRFRKNSDEFPRTLQGEAPNMR